MNTSMSQLDHLDFPSARQQQGMHCASDSTREALSRVDSVLCCKTSLHTWKRTEMIQSRVSKHK